MVKINVYLPADMAEHLHDLADRWELSISLVVRGVVADFLAHPERAVATLAPYLDTVADTSTPAQREASARYAAAMAKVDLEQVAVAMTPQPQEAR